LGTLNNFWIGKGHWTNKYFDGLLDEVRVYSDPLDADDVELHYTNGHADMAGDSIHIHHNTFEEAVHVDTGVTLPSIQVRGIPTGELTVHHNWFKTSGSRPYQTNAVGNADVYMNLYTSQRILVESE
jgi:pectate lyase